MFGLPLETTLLVFGFPLFWVLYLIGFLVVSRSWDKDTTKKDDAS